MQQVNTMNEKTSKNCLAAHELIGITTGTYHMGSGDNFANAETEEMEDRHARLFFIILGITLAAGGYQYFKKQKKKNVF